MKIQKFHKKHGLEENTVEKEVINKMNENRVKVKDTVPTVDVSISNKNILTMKENEVIFTAVLRNDKYEYKLLENPAIEIELPLEIEDISIENVTIMHKGNFEISNHSVSKNENGCFVIRVDISGEEENYKIDAIQEGTNVLISAKLKSNIKFASKKSEIKYRAYENGNEVVSKAEEIQIVSKYGIANITTISLDGQSVLSTDSERKEVKVNTQDSEKIIKVQSNILNNYEDAVASIQIVGKATDEEIGLKTDFERITNTIFAPIAVSGKNVKVYYSTDGANWSEDFADNTKMFKITCEEEFLSGETINVEYYVKVPANLKYYQEACSSLVTTGNHNGDEIRRATYFEVTTGNGPKVNMNIETSTSKDFVYEDQIVTYTINVENTGDNVIENAIIDIELPEQFIYTELVQEQLEGEIRNEYREYAELKSKQWSITNFEPKSTKTVEVNVRVGEIVSDETVFVKARVLADNKSSGEKEVIKESMVGKFVKEPAIEVNVDIDKSVDSILEEGDFLKYNITVKNISNETIKNVKAHVDLSKYVDLIHANEVNAYIDEDGIEVNKDAIYDKNNGTVEWIIDEIKPGDSKLLYLDTNIKRLEDNINSVTIDFSIKISADNIPDYESNIISHKVEGAKVRVTQTLITPPTVLEDEEIVFEIKIENNNDRQNMFTLNAILDNDIAVYTFEIYENNEQINKVYYSANEIEYSHTMEALSTVIIRINCKAKILERDTFKDVYSKGKLIIDDRDFAYNDVKCRIEKNYELIGYLKNIVLTGSVVETNNLTSETTKGLENVKVSLYNADTGKQVLGENGQPKVVTTNSEGKYEFTNVENGNYIVGYEYNSEEYTVAKNFENSEDKKNNEILVTSKTLESTETNKKIAITDVVTIEDESKYNVDINVEENEKFDLEVTQKVNKITIEGKKDTKVYDKNNQSEIKLSKSDIKNGKAIVEYKVIVKNVGNIVAYVDKIGEKLESGFEFPLELNEGWKKDTDGNIYYGNLENVSIEPGEEKEIMLILIKNDLSEKTILNNIKISESNSVKGDIEAEDNLINNNSTINIKIREKMSMFLIVALVILVIAIIIIAVIFILSKKQIKLRKVYK